MTSQNLLKKWAPMLQLQFSFFVAIWCLSTYLGG